MLRITPGICESMKNWVNPDRNPRRTPGEDLGPVAFTSHAVGPSIDGSAATNSEPFSGEHESRDVDDVIAQGYSCVRIK